MWFSSTQLDLYRRQSVTYTNTFPSTASPDSRQAYAFIYICVSQHIYHNFKWLHIICLLRIYLSLHTWRPRILWWFTKQVFGMFIHQASARRTLTDRGHRRLCLGVCVCVRESEVAVCACWVRQDIRKPNRLYTNQRHLIDVPKCLLWNYPDTVIDFAPVQPIQRSEVKEKYAKRNTY